MLYLNPNWTENMYGETIFLDKIQDMILDENDTIIQDKEYETISKFYLCSLLGHFLVVVMSIKDYF